MAVEDGVADDMIVAFVDRILRLKAEADDIAADIKEIYAEAHGNGFNKTRLGEIVTYLRKVEKDASKVEEAEAIRDLYLTAYYRAKNKPHAHAYAREAKSTTQTASVSGPFDPETGEFVTTPKITEQQDAPHPASDLTTSPSLSGQVAPHPEAKASTDGGATAQGIEAPVNSVTGDASRASVGAGSDAPIQPETANETPETATSDEGAAAPATGASPVIASVGDSGAQPTGGEDVNGPDVPATHEDFDGALDIAGATGKPVEALASAAPIYAAPGIVTMEQTPPEPVRWHPYAQCFPTVLGDDLKALERDIQQVGTVAEPIVKIGNLILDGRARYGIARSMLIGYPVVQYAGSDPLMDVIRWNLASRFDRMTSGQINTTAKALCKLEPSRTDDIMQAFGLEVAEAAE